MDIMDVASISMYMTQSRALTDVGTSVLGMTLDMVEQQGAQMSASLESLANPTTMGTVIDIAV